MDFVETVEKIEDMTDKAPLKAAFPSTLSFIGRTAKEVLFIFNAWKISSLIFKISYIAYLIYALAADIGNKFVNIGVLVFSIAYFTFDLCTKNAKTKADKQHRRKAKRMFRYGKIIKDFVKLAMAVYGICISWSNPTLIGFVLAIFSLIVFLADVLFEIVYTVAEKKLNMLRAALKEDLALLHRVTDKFAENPVVSKVGEAIKGFVSRVKETSSKK